MQSLGLVGYWSFDVGKGGAKAVDMSGRGKTKNRLAAALLGPNLTLSTFSFFGRGKNTAILSQIRLIDARRLDYKIGEISKNYFQILKNKPKALLS